jgi:P27 family predicted phage terminase small subunit
MAGRKPKPTALKKLEGNPGKRKLNTKEPMPGKGMPDCPKWLLPEAKMEWERLCVKLSEMGVLTEIDMAAFAAYCQSYARWKEAQQHIDSEGSIFETDKGYQQQTPWVGIANTNQKLMMTHEDVMQMLAETEIPFAYDHFAEGESPDPPFICFLFPGSENFAADNVVYMEFSNLSIELYTDEKDPELEDRVEAVLNDHELFWNKSEVWIESEKLYEVLYQMTV